MHMVGSSLNCVQVIAAINTNFTNFYNVALSFIQRYGRMPKLRFLRSFQLWICGKACRAIPIMLPVYRASLVAM
jgi:hypothetical protein